MPPSQAEIMVDALESKGLPYAYIGFPGEQTRIPPSREHHSRTRGGTVFLR